MAGEGTIPRDDLGTLQEDPLAVTLVDDEDILKLIILKTTKNNRRGRLLKYTNEFTQ